ncbi:hypothetical protein ACNKHX_09640 [Shigella flexneri]
MKNSNCGFKEKNYDVTLVEINVHEDKIDQFIQVFARTTWAPADEEGNWSFRWLTCPEAILRRYPRSETRGRMHYPENHGSQQNLLKNGTFITCQNVCSKS